MPRSKSTTTSLEVNLEPGWLEVDPNPPPQWIGSPNSQLEKIQDLQDVGKIHYPKDNLPIRDFGEEKIPKQAVVTVIDLDRELPPLPKEARLLCRLRPWLIRTIVSFATVTVIAAIIGGSVGGVLSRRHDSQASVSNTTHLKHKKTSPVLQNSKMASLQYMDKRNITHYRVYFQDKTGILQESAWDSDSKIWTVADISDPSVDVQMGTPLACACGYPHAMKNYTFVGT